MPRLYPQLSARSGHDFMTLKINVSPDASAAVIARACRSRLVIALAKGASLAVVVLDREQQQICPGLIASGIETEVGKVCAPMPARVVIKDRTFENWLVADFGALAQCPKRFSLTNAMVARVEPDKADRCDGKALIASAVKKGQYDKVKDAERICRRMDVGKAAANSRSFRHLLHVIGDIAYNAGCGTPMAGMADSLNLK